MSTWLRNCAACPCPPPAPNQGCWAPVSASGTVPRLRAPCRRPSPRCVRPTAVLPRRWFGGTQGRPEGMVLGREWIMAPRKSAVAEPQRAVPGRSSVCRVSVDPPETGGGARSAPPGTSRCCCRFPAGSGSWRWLKATPLTCPANRRAPSSLPGLVGDRARAAPWAHQCHCRWAMVNGKKEALPSLGGGSPAGAVMESANWFCAFPWMAPAGALS